MSSSWTVVVLALRYHATAGLLAMSPDAAITCRTNWSYGLFLYRLSRIHAWNA